MASSVTTEAFSLFSPDYKKAGILGSIYGARMEDCDFNVHGHRRSVGSKKFL